MAKKRMFAQQIIDSDAFLDMPLSTQALYFHLSMRADDDGFVNNPKKIQRMIGASDDDCRLLITKRFVLVFENGVIVIKHWRLHNTLRKDRYTPTVYQDEFMSLELRSDGAYTEKVRAKRLPNGCQMVANVETKKNGEILDVSEKYNEINEVTNGCQNGNQTKPQIRLDKNRLDKNHNHLSTEVCNGYARDGSGENDCFAPLSEQADMVAMDELKKVIDDPDAIVNTNAVYALAKTHGIKIPHNKREDIVDLCLQNILTVDNVRQCIRISKTARYPGAYLVSVLDSAVREPKQFHTNEWESERAAESMKNLDSDEPF